MNSLMAESESGASEQGVVKGFAKELKLIGQDSYGANPIASKTATASDPNYESPARTANALKTGHLKDLQEELKMLDIDAEDKVDVSIRVNKKVSE